MSNPSIASPIVLKFQTFVFFVMLSSYPFVIGAYGSYGNLNRAPFRSSVALVPQQPLLTNPFEVMGPPQEVEVGGEVEARSSSAAAVRRLCARGHWRPTEDAKLKELVAQFGPQNWKFIAEHLDGRSGKSCRLRWFNQLDPSIKKSAFTEDEEGRLIYAQSLYGNKWALICRFFPGRTDNAVKNHWHVMNARWQREESDYYRRNNPTLPWGFSLSNNAASGLTTSSTINESASTCTNISLTPSSGRPILWTFYNYNYNNLGPVQNHASGSMMGYSGERRVQTEEVGFGKFFGAWNGSCQIGPMDKLKGVVDQPNYSDSNSEVSVSESVDTKRTTTNLLTSGESENMDDKIQMPFIDFLGVGDA